MYRLVAIFCLCISSYVGAQQWSANIGLVSDYLFNGISQTNKNIAIQAGVDYLPTSNSYLGMWFSNVDYHNASGEADLYYGLSLYDQDSSNLTVGLAHYTYWGSSSSSDNNYSELNVNWYWRSFTLQSWYANDYFGTNARHIILAASYSWQLSDNASLLFTVDNSRSLDKQLFSWLADADNYWHGKISYQFQWQKVDLALSYQQVNAEQLSEPSIHLEIKRTFAW